MRTVRFALALRRLNIPHCLLPLTLSGALLTSSALGSEPVSVARATDVVRQWQPGQHLYVKGKLGVTAAAH